MKPKPPSKPKDPNAVALGRRGGTRRSEVLSADERNAIATLGGLRGGKARAGTLSKARRSEIAKKAAESRWAKSKKGVSLKTDD